MSWIYFLAKRFQSKGRRSGIRLVSRLAILGIALGVATLLLTQSVLSGFEKVFKESLQGFSAHVAVLRYGGIPDPEGFQESLKVPFTQQLEAVTPFFYRETLLVAGGKVRGAALKGIDPLTFGEVYAVELTPFASSQVPASIQDLLKSSQETPSLILGEDLAHELGINAEKPKVKVFLPTEIKEAGAQSKRFQSFHVVGTFRAGLKELDQGFALADRKQLAQAFGEVVEEELPATGLEFRLKDADQAQEVASKMTALLGPGYEVYSWQQLNEPLFRALRLERILFFILIAMVVAVAAFNVIGVLLLMIFEKKREISVLRALGSSGAALRRLWVLQGLGLGIVGAVSGMLLALLLGFWLKHSQVFRLAKEIYWIDQLPIQASGWVLGGVFGVSLLMIWAVTLFAVRQVRRTPLEL